MKKFLFALLFVSSNAFAAASFVDYFVILQESHPSIDGQVFNGQVIVTPHNAQATFSVMQTVVDFGDGQSAIHEGSLPGVFVGSGAFAFGISTTHLYAPGTYEAVMSFDAVGSFPSGSGFMAPQIPTGFHQQQAFSITVVPEPETYALMLAGLGLLGFVARRRKQKAD